MLNLSRLDRDYDYWQIWRGYYDGRKLRAEYDTYAEALIAVKRLLIKYRPNYTEPVEVNGRLRWYLDDGMRSYYEIEGCYNAES